MSGFSFKFRPRYAEAVEGVLYNYESIPAAPDHTFMYLNENRVVCLLCGVGIGSSVTVESALEHLDSEEHLIGARRDVFDSFHEYFLKLPDDQQYQQMYFIPLVKEIVFCTACKSEVYFRDISSHVNSTEHLKKCVEYWPRDLFLKGENRSKQSDLTKEISKNVTAVRKKSSLRVIYSKEIVTMFYPKNIVKCMMNEDGLNVSSVQRLLEDTQCLLCQTVLLGVMTKADIKNHVQSVRHKAALKDKGNVDALIAYHLFWSGLNVLGLQVKQMYFGPFDEKRAFCLICEECFSYKSLILHCQTEHKQSNYRSFCWKSIDNDKMDQDNNASLSTTLIIQNSKHSLKNVSGNTEGSDPTCKTGDVESIATMMNDVSITDSNNKERTFSFTKKHPDETTKRDLKIDKSSKHPRYDPKVSSRLFSVYFKNEYIKATEYSVQIRSQHEIFCLLCGRAVQDKVKLHSAGKKHQANLEDPERIAVLEMYHWFWLGQPADKQFLQIRFNPHNLQSMKCISCNNIVEMSVLMEHPCLENGVYHNYRVPEEYRSFDNKYESKLFTKYCSTSFQSIAKTILDTELPLVMHFINFMYCLLCGKKIFRSPKIWHAHLLEHAVKAKTLKEALPFVWEYHQFWQSLKPYYQIYMIHYVPNFKGGLKCVKGHPLPYNRAIAHTEICPINNFKRIIKSLKLQHLEKDEGGATVSFGRDSESSEKSKTDGSPLSHQNSGDSEREDSSNVKLHKNSVDSEEGSSCSNTKTEPNSDSECEEPVGNSNSDDSDAEQNCDNSENKSNSGASLMEETLIQGAVKDAEDVSESEEEDETQNGTDSESDKNDSEEKHSPGEEKCVEEPDERVLEYDEDTLYTIYPNFNTMNRSRRPRMYFMQRRSAIMRYCLLCNKQIIGIPVEHTRSKKHLENAERQRVLQLLETYHAFWMSLPPEQQLLQIYFNPYTCTSFKCDVCNKIISHQSAINHPCPATAKKEVIHEVAEEFRKFEVKLDEIVAKKFISKTYTDITQAVLNTEIPLVLHLDGRASCLLCGSSFFRDPGLWYTHLLNHCKDFSMVQRRLVFVLQYHQFWQEEPLEIQICMIHYYPDFRGAMKCAKGHLVFYDELYKHLRKCPVDKYEKLRKMVDNGTVKSEQAAVDNTSESGESEVSDCGVEFSESADKATPGEGTMKDKGTSKPLIVLTESEKNLVKMMYAKGTKLMKHIVKPSLDINSTSTDGSHLIVNRHRVHLIFKGDTARCKPCNLDINNKPADLLWHCAKPEHTSKAEKMKRKYICDVCLKNCNTEQKWMMHMLSTEHELLCEKCVHASKILLQEYECLSCLAVLFGDEKFIRSHEHQSRRKRKPPITVKPEALKLFQDEKSTQMLAIKLKEDIERSEEKDAKLVHNCLRGFEAALKKVYPECKAYPFGSRMTGIGSSDSDLDVFIDLGDMYFDNKYQKIQQEIVLKVKKILLENRKSFSDIIAITHARTPIIRVVHTATQIDCDLSFRHGLSVENTRFIKFCFDLQPVCRLAMLILKKWADIVSLKDEITSYALCMIFIFYMQLNGYLLSVTKLHELTGEDVPTIDGWKIVRLHPTSHLELRSFVKIYEGNVFELLQQFFQMYKEFDFENETVCPLLGKPVPVKLFENKGIALPAEMESLKTRLISDPLCKFKISAMCVQDPFDLAHNLTKAVMKSFREKFQTFCFLTEAHMRAQKSR